MHLLISDRGNFGKAISEACGERVSYCFFSAPMFRSARDTIGIYVGRGRHFGEFLNYCTMANVPVLQCSSDIDLAGRKLGTPVFDVPNAAEMVMLFLKQMEQLSEDLKRRGIEVDWVLTESHQASKSSPPRTALRIAEILGIPTRETISLRRRPEFHAHHILQGYVKGSSEMLEYACRVKGLAPYAQGVLRLAIDLCDEIETAGRRQPGLYRATDIRPRP